MAGDEDTASAAARNSDLDPAAFLKSVRELSEKREREDTERYRQLEEKVHKEREERAARRADRARSISPEKLTPPTSPSTRTLSRPTTNASLVSSPEVTMTAPSTSEAMEPSKTASPKVDADVPEFKGFGSIKRSSASVSSRSSVRSSASEVPASSSSTQSPLSTEHSQQSATGLARSGTLTWNRRPQSHFGRSRPQSQIAASRPQSQLGASRPQSHAASATEAQSVIANTESVSKPEPSRDQIAASLGARDPSWFRQTPDRGIGSAAFRKSQVEEHANETPSVVGRRGLPGLSKDPPQPLEAIDSPSSSASFRSESVSGDGSVRGSIISAGSRFSAISASSNSKPDLKSLIAEDEGQRKVSPSYKAPPDDDSTASNETTGIARALTMSSSQARIAGVDRPSSPTKGMGGFVQSAMMKRSDSQNKRWNAQPGTSMSRSNSVVSNRSGLGGLQGSHSMPKLDPSFASSEPVKDVSSRPTSSSNDLTKLVTEPDNDGFVKPALPSYGHSRAKSVASIYSTNDDLPGSPSSPSKRFSPSKSSWLESSLTKPEQPKPAPAKNSQPSWMADLATRKAQRGSVDLGTPLSAGGERSRPSSPVKETPFGQSILKRAESRDLPKTPTSATATHKLRSFKLAENSEQSPPATSSSHKLENPNTLDAPINFEPKNQAPQQKIVESETEVENEKAAPATLSLDTPEMPPSTTALPKPRSPLPTSGPSTPEPGEVRQRSKSSAKKSPPAPSSAKVRPENTPRLPSDFRSQLKSRPPAEPKSDSQPEFLAKIGALRKTQQEKFVAPDVLKSNILRGKSDLQQTGGPVKTARRDELKEDLLAKKDEFKKAKEEGRDLPGAVYARKISETKPPIAPSKPEALAKRELLGRSDSAKSAASVSSLDRSREATPEALTRAKSLKSRTANEPPQDRTAGIASPGTSGFRKELTKTTSLPPSAVSEDQLQPISKQTSAPTVAKPSQVQETSRLASRFNPGLANILARGPPSQGPSRTGSPATSAAFPPPVTTPSEPPVAGAPLEDMRKDRAKGPKKRKAGSKAPAPVSQVPSAEDSSASLPSASMPGMKLQEKAILPKPVSAGPRSQVFQPQDAAPDVSSLPTKLTQHSDEEHVSHGVESSAPRRARTQNAPGSMGALMRASLDGPALQVSAPSPVEPSRDSSPATEPGALPKRNSATGSITSLSSVAAVPDFKGFNAARSSQSGRSSIATGDDKENSRPLPSVKTATSLWGRRPSLAKSEPPAQIQLPNKKDEEAAMRSAGLLAASPQASQTVTIAKSGERPPTLVSPSAPPKPTKSSRIVSGQLTSPNKGDTPVNEELAQTRAGRLLASTFKHTPRYRDALAIDTSAVIDSKALCPDLDSIKTIRRKVMIVFTDGSIKTLPPQQEYTLYDESVFICIHNYANEKGIKACQIYVWAGDTAPEMVVETALVVGKRISRENGSNSVHLIRQGFETAAFLSMLGGIVVTRCGARDSAPQQFMLCGRKVLGNIAFDEVDFAVDSLCAGFVYLISYPVTLQEIKLYLWKGAACSFEELSAARIAAMDLSDTGEIIEVDGGVEFTSFLKIFGTNTTKASIARPTELWLHKAMAPTKFNVRLLRIQQAPQRTGLMTAIWSRRPSWNSRSPARTTSSPGGMEVKVEVKEVTPVLQAQLEADGIYLLDAYGELYILLGPLFASNLERTRNAVLGQTLLFASDYAVMAASMEDRPRIPKCWVLFGGVPRDVKLMFRHWDDGTGLWGTEGLLAGNVGRSGGEVVMIELEEVLDVVCRGT